jgi:hypothetical protein
MSFFYDLNKKLADLAAKQDAKQISEEAKAVAPKSKLAESMAVAEVDYSAKKASAGKDIGKPGKNFAKIAKSAGKAYGSKAAGERVAGAVLNKLRAKESVEEGIKQLMHKDAERMSREKFVEKYPGEGYFWDKISGPVDESAFQAAIGKKKYGDQGMKALQKAGREHASAKTMSNIRNRYDKYDEAIADEGNEFSGALANARKDHKSEFEVDGKKYKVVEADPTGLGEEEMGEGYAEMDAWLKSREAEKGTGKFDKKERTLPSGMKATTYTRRHEEEPEDNSDAPTSKGGAPKKRGRPMGKPKGPERVTKGAWKHKAGRMNEAGTCPHCGGSLNDDELDEEKVEAGKREFFDKLAPAAKKAAKVIGVMSKSKKAVDKESTEKKDTNAEKASKKVTKDIEHDDKKDRKEKKTDEGKGDGNLANNAKPYDKVTQGDVVAGRLGKDEMGGKKKKEEKVDETTVAGSVATSSGSKSTGGMSFGKGVYEGFNNKVESIISEGINVSINMNAGEDGEARKSITVSADGAEADQLAELLKMAGLHGQADSSCDTCGQSPCGCESLEENTPDWPTDQETSNNALQYSGGLNGPKSTGQTTVPVIASQLRRQVSMEENVKLERSLFKTWKNYKG